jgi:hypothetical protein
MRSTSCFLAALVLGLVGCEGAFAGANPCGGIQTSETTATVGGVPATGSVVVTTTTANSYSLSPTSDQSCDASVLGNAGPEGTSSLTFEVGCGEASVRVTVPDVRFLADGTQEVAAEITTDNDSHLCASGTATLTVASASGSSAPGPDFVTADFLRVVSVALDSSPWTASADNVASDGCPAKVALDATLHFTKGSFTPAESSTPITAACPPVPYK